MSGGILSGILGGAIGGDQAQMGNGILGNMNQYMTNNAGTLLGFGAGMLAGDNALAAQGAMQGMQADQRTRLLKRQEAEEEQKRIAAQQLAERLGRPELAQFPEIASSLYLAQNKPKDPQLVGSAETGFAWLTPGQELPENLAKGTGPKANLELKTIKNADGSESMVMFNPRTGSMAPVQGYGGNAPRQGNPYSTGKMTESEANAATYADRMARSHQLLNSFEGTLTNSSEVGRANAPLVGNFLASENYQQAEQAQRDFVNAILRRESGAAISPAEFDNARKQYFPQPGDSEKVIEQKRKNRITAIQGNMRGAGQAYRPPTGWEDPATAGQKPPSEKQQEGRKGPVGIGAGRATYGSSIAPGQQIKHPSGAIITRIE